MWDDERPGRKAQIAAGRRKEAWALTLMRRPGNGRGRGVMTAAEKIFCKGFPCFGSLVTAADEKASRKQTRKGTNNGSPER